jgi:two-component system response regulator (stage 0 sporulation protein F)
MTTILIMDEDQTIRMLYSSELSEEGYDVLGCGDAAGLMDLIGCRKPDLVVMEVQGNYNGLTLLQDISHAYTGLPVILCTTCPAFREDPRSLAARDYVVKSSKISELKAVIRNVLDGGTASPPASLPMQADLHEPMAQMSLPWESAR